MKCAIIIALLVAVCATHILATPIPNQSLTSDFDEKVAHWRERINAIENEEDRKHALEYFEAFVKLIQELQKRNNATMLTLSALDNLDDLDGKFRELQKQIDAIENVEDRKKAQEELDGYKQLLEALREKFRPRHRRSIDQTRIDQWRKSIDEIEDAEERQRVKTAFEVMVKLMEKIHEELEKKNYNRPLVYAHFQGFSPKFREHFKELKKNMHGKLNELLGIYNDEQPTETTTEPMETTTVEIVTETVTEQVSEHTKTIHAKLDNMVDKLDSDLEKFHEELIADTKPDLLNSTNAGKANKIKYNIFNEKLNEFYENMKRVLNEARKRLDEMVGRQVNETSTTMESTTPEEITDVPSTTPETTA